MADEIVNALRRPSKPPESPLDAEAVRNQQPQSPNSAPSAPSTVHGSPESSPSAAEAVQNQLLQSPDGALSVPSAVYSSPRRSPDAAGLSQSPQPPSAESEPTGPPAAASTHQSESPPGDVAIQFPIPAPPRPSLAEKARRFVAAFNGGDCFLIKRLDESGGNEAYLGFGRDPAPFQRFDTNYKTEVGAEADVRGALIKQEQCAALDLIRLSGAESAAGPRLELQNGDVSRGKPLTGKITNLSARRLYLIRIDDQGFAHRLEVKSQSGGDTATFNIALVPEAGSSGSNQILLAVVSDASIAVLENLHKAPLQSIARRLVEEAHRATASVQADYFKFVD
jgi:hypothetical protein